MKKNSIFYIYAGQVPAIKNYKQMKNVFPYKIQSLKKIIILLINEALEEKYTKDLIKLAIENLEIIEETELDLGKLKEKFQNHLNSIITDDDLKITDKNETSYHLTKKGLKLQNILYELAILNIEEEYSGIELEEVKNELKKLKSSDYLV
jgi:hypothetical protein